MAENIRYKVTGLINNLFYLLKQFLHFLTGSLRESESSGINIQSLPPLTQAPKLTLLLHVETAWSVAPW